MRILFVSGEYPPETGGGGIGSYVASMGAALAWRGHHVEVLSCAEGMARRDYLDGEVVVHRRPIVAGALPRNRYLRSATVDRIRAAASCLVQERGLGGFDVVEIPDWMAEGLGLALLHRYPLVAQLHTPVSVIVEGNGGRIGRDFRSADLLERTAVRHVDVVTSPSALLADRLEQRRWLPKETVRVIPLAVDVERWAAVSPAESAPARVLFVGRLEHRKAPEVLVDAAALLAVDVPGIEVLFVGRSNGERDGLPYGEWVERRARALRAPCRFLDQVPRGELPELLAQARVMAVPSRFDNFPMAALEAMASGRPVVCTDQTGTAELLTPAGAGTVVTPESPAALANALRAFLIDPSAAGSAGRRGRTVVTTTCSPDRIAERREDAYRDAIVRFRSGRRLRLPPNSETRGRARPRFGIPLSSMPPRPPRSGESR